MEEVPLLRTLHEKYADQGAVILGISIDDTVARAEKTIREKGMTWPQIATDKGSDGDIPLKYGVNGTPTIFVLDRAGRIVARPGSAKQLEESLLVALATRVPH
jgi:peroxiredoxin